jgi:Putative adhesin
MRITSRPSALAAAALGCAGTVALSACGSSSTGGQASQPHPAQKAKKAMATSAAAGGGSATAAGPVHSLQVSTDSGSVTVTGTSGAVVTDERVGNSMVPAPHKLSDGALTVGSSGGSHSYYIEVPKSAAVNATTTNGAIRLTSLAGPVQATAASGTVSGQDLSAQNATFSSHTGSIDSSFGAPPKNIAATAQTGSVILRVPRSASYEVSAHSGRGASQVLVPKSTSAPHVITATAGSGPVMVMPI